MSRPLAPASLLPSTNVTNAVSRRAAIALGGVAALSAAAMATPALASSRSRQPQGGKPDKRPEGPTTAAGKPVSQTAAAQEGKPVVPGAPARKVRLALVGLGKLMVEEILPALKMTSHCEIAALVTGDREKGNAIADNVGLPRERVFGYEDIAKFAGDETIDAVYIATPNGLHARHTIAALKAGKHVLCEKPMAPTREECDAMIAAAKDAGKKLMIAYRVHFEPINTKLREVVQAKRFGQPHFVVFDAVQDVGKKPQPRLSKETGGGSLWDIGIYALNTTRWLLGEEPIEVSAMQRAANVDPRFDEVEGSIAFQLRFPSGCVANCTSSFGTTNVNRYKVICEKGWVGMDPATRYRGLKGAYGDDETGETEMSKPETVNQFAAEFDHFAQCVKDDQPVATPGEEGRRDVDLILKIYEAARTGTVVKV